MAKATIREDNEVLAEIVRAEWQEVAEEIGSEINQLFANGCRTESLAIEFDGYSATEWEALPEDQRAAMEETGES